MPSNRPLASARRSIESAVAFCIAQGGELVISDNAGDPEKSRWLRTLGEPVILIENGPPDAAGNMLSAYQAARGEFLLPMGDDDFIRSGSDWTAPDANTDHVGFRPLTEILGRNDQIVRTQTWIGEGDDGPARMLDYMARQGGDNSIYYSFWRAEPFMRLCRLFCLHHPTKAGMSDWAMVMALLGRGKIGAASGTVFTYRLGAWQDAAEISASRNRMLERAGLPLRAAHFSGLLQFLDTHVYLHGFGPDFSNSDRDQAIHAAMIGYLRPFLRQVHQDPAAYPEVGGMLGDLIKAASGPPGTRDVAYSLAVNVVERLKPGLKEGYEAFLAAALSSSKPRH